MGREKPGTDAADSKKQRVLACYVSVAEEQGFLKPGNSFPDPSHALIPHQ